MERKDCLLLTNFIESLNIKDVYQEENECIFFKIDEFPFYLKVKDNTISHDHTIPCPFCPGKIIEKNRLFICDNSTTTNPCFCLFKVYLGKKIERKMIKNLVENGESDIISGFISKSGKTFQAKLALNGKRVVLNFASDDESDKPKNPEKKCPICGECGEDACELLTDQFDELFERLKTFESIRLFWLF
jgi:hypothetical protein